MYNYYVSSQTRRLVRLYFIALLCIVSYIVTIVRLQALGTEIETLRVLFAQCLQKVPGEGN